MIRLPGAQSIVQQNIDRHGQHVFAVFPDKNGPGFAYTVGNANLGLPELLIIGNFVPHTSAGILNQLGQQMRDAGVPLAGDISLGGRFPVRIRQTRADVRSRYTIQAGRYLGHERYDVLQLLLCDRDGRYPGEAGCDPDFDVPLA